MRLSIIIIRKEIPFTQVETFVRNNNLSFLFRARRIRKVLGGGLRQVGIAAAAGIVALNTTYKGLYKVLCQ